MRRWSWVLLCLAFAAPAQSQEVFSLFVPSDDDDVKRMLVMAALREGDVVYDLGSGDGRIVIAAARMNPGVRGRGIEIDGKLVRESTAAAAAAGLADRVQFLHQNVFDAELGEATVITMWLFPELMRLLRPKILAEARPGTRVITRTWDLGSWRADEVDDDGMHVYKWVVPAKVAGYWTWEIPAGDSMHTYSAILEQRFQDAEGVVRVGARRGLLENMVLRGDEIAFTLTMTMDGSDATRHEFKGRVDGDAIEGTVSVLHKGREKPQLFAWRARRTAQTTYFAPTGIGVK